MKKIKLLIPTIGSIGILATTLPFVTSCNKGGHLTFKDSDKKRDIIYGQEVTVLCPFTLKEGFDMDEDIKAEMKDKTQDWDISCNVQAGQGANQLELRFTYNSGAQQDGEILKFNVEITVFKTATQKTVWSEFVKDFKFTFHQNN